MNIIPAIDLIGGKAVRLQKGDYAKMTIYNDSPLSVAKEFEKAGAKFLHVVDLDGAKSGGTDNYDVISAICRETSLSVEVGGGIRNMEALEKYVNAGVDRIIIGTAAVTDPEFLRNAVAKYGNRVAVGVDIKAGMVAIKGWLEETALECMDFCRQLQDIGVATVICTDISKDGMMKGTNLELYREMSQKLSLNVIASGGVSTLDDVRALKEMGVFGAILGKALYTGAISLKDALNV